MAETKQNRAEPGSFLSFIVDNETYGINIADITDIMAIPAVSSVPMVADYMEGVINLRGKIIPIINLRVRFGKSRCNFDKNTCVIVFMIKEYLVGVIVDKVCDVVRFTSENTFDSAMGKNRSRFIKSIVSIDSVIYQILDVKKVASDKHEEEENENIG